MSSTLVCSILLGTCRQGLVGKHSIKSKSKRGRENIPESPSDGESRGQTYLTGLTGGMMPIYAEQPVTINKA